MTTVPMPTLSLTMIVRDEQETIGRVLGQAAQFCDELVVVDTGSSDATRSIAERLGARVIDFPWIDDFAAARNCALQAATGDWVLWLDADDVLPTESIEAFKAVKRDELRADVDAIYLPYRYHYDDAGRCTMEFPRERLVRVVDGLHWDGRVHEVLHVPGSALAHRDVPYVEHRPAPSKRAGKVDRNLRILESALADGDRSPRTLLYYARELCDHERFDDAYRAFADYITNPGSTWEHHSALVRMAQCALATGKVDQARARMYDALSVDSSRAEPFLGLGGLHFDREEWSQALPWFAAATSLAPPSSGFTQPADYGWRPWDFLSVCLINSGRFNEGVTAIAKALELGAPDAERLRKNADWALQQLSGE